MGEVIKFLVGNIDTIKTVAELVVFLILAMSNSARGSIAAVYEILKGGADMTDEQALQKASDLMGKKFPFLPDGLRKMVIQWLFDNLKGTVKKNQPTK